MGATFPRIKNWTTEVLSNTDLNLEIDNILNNLGPAGVDDYSTNSTQMRLQTSPGTVGSESLATSLAGEFERLRYVIQRMIGGTSQYWYEAPPITLSDLVAAIGAGLPPNRIVSGRTTGNSSQLCALIPNGTSASVVLTASVTPFTYYIDGTQYSITANQTLTGLSLAPSTNNTCSFNNTAASGQQWTRMLGMYATQIDVDNMNTSISAVVGQIAGFQAGNEYFMGYVNSTTSLTDCWRGGMFNSAGANITSVGISDNAEVKLLRLAWIFANTSASLAVTYANPTVSAVQPTSPNTGDYWFDLGTTAWKTFNSTTWVAANATLIGVTMQSTAACVAARTFDSYKAQNELNTANLMRASNTVVQASARGAEVSVFGNANRFGPSRPTWDIASNLEAGLVETQSATYYAYIKETGGPLLSDKAPIKRRDLYGFYHPGETWRCLGSVHNNLSSNFEEPVRSFQDGYSPEVLMGSPEAYGMLVMSDSVPDLINPATLYPSKYAYAVNASIVFTAAQASWQPIATISLASGIWKLQATGRVGWAGIATIGTTATFHLTNLSGTAASVLLPVLNFMEINVAGASNSEGCQLPPVFVYATVASTYYLKYSIDETAGITWTGHGQVYAERIEPLIGGAP